VDVERAVEGAHQLYHVSVEHLLDVLFPMLFLTTCISESPTCTGMLLLLGLEASALQVLAESTQYPTLYTLMAVAGHSFPLYADL
jgi:hypothetical protein